MTYYARSASGLFIFDRNFLEDKLVKTKEDLRQLSMLAIVPTQQIGGEYESVAENEHAAIPSLDELHQLNLNLIADFFPAKQRAYLSRLKTSSIWVPYQGQLRYSLQLNAFELFTLKYYNIFFLPSMLECKRRPVKEVNCILEIKYDGLTMQSSKAIWTSPYHIFRIGTIEDKEGILYIQLSSATQILEKEIRPSLESNLFAFAKKGGMPLDRDVTSSQLVYFAKLFHA